MKKFCVSLLMSVGLVLGSFTLATPALAYICPTNDLCAYDWVNWNSAGGVWVVSYATIDAQSGDCMTLPNVGAHFNNGVNVDNRITSWTINQMGGTHDLIEFYALGNCNTGSGLGLSADANPGDEENDMTNSIVGNFNDDVTSIHICKNCQP